MESDAEAKETNATVLDFGVVLLLATLDTDEDGQILIGRRDTMRTMDV